MHLKLCFLLDQKAMFTNTAERQVFNRKRYHENGSVSFVRS